ncbi:hypothetical protein P9847_09365 [Paenibacillus chibensis]|uniref:Uncharacterized protein n=1 Tax=Paenibacillus chibensis TaxID=59846 RepID=A0ABU6PRK4_9BACL|nr:hypothetical protein [Paenibacillus chibensis]
MALLFHQKRPLPNENQAKVSQNNVYVANKAGDDGPVMTTLLHELLPFGNYSLHGIIIANPFGNFHGFIFGFHLWYDGIRKSDW